MENNQGNQTESARGPSEPVLLTALEEQAFAASSFLKSLTNPHRLLTLCLLLEGPRSVSELLERLPISQSALSQHLKIMKEGGIVTSTRAAQRQIYRIVDADVEAILRVLHRRLCE